MIYNLFGLYKILGKSHGIEKQFYEKDNDIKNSIWLLIKDLAYFFLRKNPVFINVSLLSKKQGQNLQTGMIIQIIIITKPLAQNCFQVRVFVPKSFVNVPQMSLSIYLVLESDKNQLLDLSGVSRTADLQNEKPKFGYSCKQFNIYSRFCQGILKS